MLRRSRSFLRDQSGSTAIEYGVIAMVALLIVGALQSLSMHLDPKSVTLSGLAQSMAGRSTASAKTGASGLRDPTETGSIGAAGTGRAQIRTLDDRASSSQRPTSGHGASPPEATGILPSAISWFRSSFARIASYFG